MAIRFRGNLFQTKLLLQNAIILGQNTFFHTSPVWSEVQAGRVKISVKGNKPITYEKSGKPHNIGQRKAWNSWNTSTLSGEHRAAETLVEDMFIRKFVFGTFPGLVLSEVIIKRQHNIIRLAVIMFAKIPEERLCFLIGYTEEILGLWLQCPVKLELQVVASNRELIYKYV